MRKFSQTATRSICTAALAIAGLGGTPALAHHSAAMFDRTRIKVVNGTVLKYDYAAPHSWISVIERGAAGKPDRWDAEGGEAFEMSRAGVTPETLKPGDKVTMRVFPMRDGRHGGALIDIKLASGKVAVANVTLIPKGNGF